MRRAEQLKLVGGYVAGQGDSTAWLLAQLVFVAWREFAGLALALTQGQAAKLSVGQALAGMLERVGGSCVASLCVYAWRRSVAEASRHGAHSAAARAAAEQAARLHHARGERAVQPARRTELERATAKALEGHPGKDRKRHSRAFPTVHAVGEKL